MDPLTAMPESLTAGTTLKLTLSDSRFPSNDGWTAMLYVAGAQKVSAGGDANGSAFDFTLTSTQTGSLSPGNYRWLVRYTKAGESYDGGAGYVSVLRDLAAAAAGDALGFAEKTLSIVELAISGNLEDGMESFQIAGRSVVNYSLEDLMKTRNRLIAEIQSLRSGGRTGRQHLVTFLPPRSA